MQRTIKVALHGTPTLGTCPCMKGPLLTEDTGGYKKCDSEQKQFDLPSSRDGQVAGGERPLDNRQATSPQEGLTGKDTSSIQDVPYPQIPQIRHDQSVNKLHRLNYRTNV
ncbi:hypothetical protein Bbelb_141590 [Branchiostoma belcheri]|nr:hypothetical protein Bbelb_141590 [Branchiostoma belcheri]